MSCRSKSRNTIQRGNISRRMFMAGGATLAGSVFAAAQSVSAADAAHELSLTSRTLDVKGKALGSEAIAKTLAAIRDDGNKSAAVLIGGPDGMSPSLLEATKLRLSLGAITLPHGLARIVLAEQLYRAATILSGHPYHRA